MTEKPRHDTRCLYHLRTNDRAVFVGHAGEFDVYNDTNQPEDYAVLAARPFTPVSTANLVWLQWDGTWFVPAYTTFLEKHATPAQVCAIAATVTRHREENGYE